MKKVQSELNILPKSFADNPQANLLSLCATFIQEIDNYTNGKPNPDPNQATFLQDVLQYYKVLKSRVNCTRPRFVVSTPAFSNAEKLKDSVNSKLEDTSTASDSSATGVPKGKRVFLFSLLMSQKSLSNM